MKQLLLGLLVSLGLSTEWGTSVSVRTSNDDTKPLDYEVSVKLEETDGNKQIVFVKKDGTKNTNLTKANKIQLL